MKELIKLFCTSMCLIIICSSLSAQKKHRTIYGLHAKSGWSDQLLKLDVKAFSIVGQSVMASDGYIFSKSPDGGYILHSEKRKPTYTKRDEVDIVGETDDHIVTLACYGCAPQSGCIIMGKGTLAPYCSGCSNGNCTTDFTFFLKGDDTFTQIETPDGGY